MVVRWCCSSATKTASNLAALDKLSAAADETSGVVRFDTYEEMLKPTPSITFPAMKLFTYTVCKDQRSMRAWRSSMKSYLRNFDSDELTISSPGLETETANEIAPQTEAHPIFFWAYVNEDDFDTTRDDFAKINVPTRDEPGSIRYDNSCTKKRRASGGRTFCFENVWYDTLPSAQDAHMSTAHMGVFFGDTAGVVIEWGMSTLNLLSTQSPSSLLQSPSSPSISYIKLIGGGADNSGAVEKLARIPECNYQGMGPDMYKVVPDKCCMLETWTDAGFIEGDNADVTFSAWNKNNNGHEFSCPVGDLGALGGFPTWVRGYQGCENGKVAYAESCVPKNLPGGAHGWPMSAEVAAQNWEDGDHDSCHCEEPNLVGDQCFVGKTFPGFAFFGYSKGDASCAQ